MAKYRHRLPQLDGRLFLTDGGIETSLIVYQGHDMSPFAAAHLLDEEGGQIVLRRYFQAQADIAHEHGVGLVLECATWRASGNWGVRLGYDGGGLGEMSRAAVRMLANVRDALETDTSPVAISGCMAPPTDTAMTTDHAYAYYRRQAELYASTEADLVTAVAMSDVGEAVGMVRAAVESDVPVVVAFSLGKDGRLPNGMPLAEAIEQVDDATDGATAYFMIDCAHPVHFTERLEPAPWMMRVRGVRSSASTRACTRQGNPCSFSDADPIALAADLAALVARFPWLNVLGGRCGTDDRHVAAICRSCLPTIRPAA
ncbi:MAG: homocysteine S-methyltransferase family protein [Pseudomonadota bacterium]